MPPYVIRWEPDPQTRRAGWWYVDWPGLEMGSRLWWDAPHSGYAWSRRGAEREVRRKVRRLNRGMARKDWA